MTIKSTPKVAASGYTTTLRDNMRSIYKSQLASNFSTTLNTVPDIVNILVSQAFKESSFNTNALGPVLSASSSVAKDYLYSPAIATFLATATPTQKAHVYVGIQGLGMGQSLGLNSIRGGSAKTGKCLIETARPDLAGQLCVNPGDDLVATFLGDSNLEKALMLQMVVLEQKFKNIVTTSQGYLAKGDIYNRVFPSKIAAAVAAYLGLGRADSLGTTPEQYASSIVGGTIYQTANGTNLQVAQRAVQTVATAGPSTNGSGQTRVNIAGC